MQIAEIAGKFCTQLAHQGSPSRNFSSRVRTAVFNFPQACLNEALAADAFACSVSAVAREGIGLGS